MGILKSEVLFTCTLNGEDFSLLLVYILSLAFPVKDPAEEGINLKEAESFYSLNVCMSLYDNFINPVKGKRAVIQLTQKTL